MGRYSDTTNKPVNIDPELRPLLSKATAEAVERVEALQATATKVRHELADARDAVQAAEAADLAAEVEAVKTGGTAPKPKAPKAREAFENLDRRNKALTIALRDAQREVRELIEAERHTYVEPARKRTDKAIAAVMEAFEHFADTLAAETPGMELALVVEGGYDLAGGVKSNPSHEVGLAVRDLRNALEADYLTGEVKRREAADKPPVDAGDDIEVTEGGKVKRQRVMASEVW